MFSRKIPQVKDTILDLEKNQSPEEANIIFPSFTIITPIKNVIEAYQYVFVSRIINCQIEKILSQKGIIYSSSLELTKDFSNRIFATFVLPVMVDDLPTASRIVKKVIFSIPKDQETLFQEKKKLLEELERKKNNPLQEEINKIDQRLEWNNSLALSIEKEIGFINDINLTNISSWWRKKIKQSHFFSLFY